MKPAGVTGALRALACSVCEDALLGRAKVVGARLARFAVGDHLVRDLLALIERAHARALNRADVNEYVAPAGVRRDKSISFGRVEPLDRTHSHRRIPVE